MKLVIPITPTPQMRDRIGAVRRRDGTVRAMSFKDKKQRNRENALIAYLRDHQPDVPLSGPLLLGMRVYLPAPKTKPDWFDGTTVEFRRYAAQGVLRPPVTPDLDNFLKNCMDCLTRCAFWRDDKQVVGYLPGIGKYYTADRPRWEIEITAYDWRRAADRGPQGGGR